MLEMDDLREQKGLNFSDVVFVASNTVRTPQSQSTNKKKRRHPYCERRLAAFGYRATARIALTSWV